MGKYKITEEIYKEVKESIKKNQKKRVDKRLQVIALRYEGKTNIEIAEQLKYSPRHVSNLFREFQEKGLTEYSRHKYGGNRQILSPEKEKEILEEFRKQAEAGQLVTASKIKTAFDEYLKKDTGSNYIYELLSRHKWRMVMPRGKHPKSGSDEEVEASKKLTKNTKKF